MLITSTGSKRGKKPIALKEIADKGIEIAAKQGFQVSSQNLSLELSLKFQAMILALQSSKFASTKHKWFSNNV